MGQFSPPASVVTYASGFADILTQLATSRRSVSLDIVPVLCSLGLGQVLTIFLHRVIQESVYLRNPDKDDRVIGCRPLFTPLATVYLPRRVSSGTRPASVDSYWIVSTRGCRESFMMHPNQKGTNLGLVLRGVAWYRRPFTFSMLTMLLHRENRKGILSL
ncbi:hypothetical protein BDV26DRAFT_170798 [Aspergillus bertholletiae]|uniref:Uncharacterized protein n=1 Tax=Aspergillus bertholletiae TaxID=1226010 RepID=A0A5N7BCA5_9EURO|nr:hypothetical protein BDV26DRAFT_170798 [Aspergillus bertholletiae]